MSRNITFEQSLASNLHRVINSAFWIENEGWEAKNTLGQFACDIVRKLPISPHDVLKKALLTDSEAIVNGESIVIPTGDTVDKFMFRRPPTLSLEQFRERVQNETAAVIRHIGNIALATEVAIKDTSVFRWPLDSVRSVTQTQARLDLSRYQALNGKSLAAMATDQTARDLELLLTGIDQLAEEEGFYPDLGENSGNLRISTETGDLKLIDVMPVYADGQRLIADSARILPSTLEVIANFREYVGSFDAGR